MSTLEAPARISLSRLRARLAGPVIGPGDAGYDAARAVFSPAVDRRPAAVVQPLDAGDVLVAVDYAGEHGLELAVRSGGHGAAGHGTSEGGLVVDLSRMKALDIDPERRVAWAQTGLTAGEVTAALAPHDLAVSFGDTGSVGIGGLTLGGGVGYLVRRHGLTVDSLLGAEMVTARGDLLYADAEHHPDLFWALRGGGGNFGVATRFAYRLQPLGIVTGGMLVLPASAETIAGFVAAAEAAPDELSTIANVMPAPPLPFLPAEARGRPVVLAMLLYAGAGVAAERALAPFRALAEPVVDALRPMSLPEMSAAEEGPRPRSVVRTVFADDVDVAAGERILERLRASSAAMPVVQLRVLGGAMARVADGATAFAHRRRRVMLGAAAMYGRPEEAPLHEAWADESVAALATGEPGAYVNFLGDEGPERVRAAYPGATWGRLAAVKRRYDPDNLFRLNQNIPPADAGDGKEQT